MSAPPPLQDDPQRRTTERASYQAPTSSSLARSHPVVFASAIGRSPARSPRKPNQARTRGLGLRDRKALRPSLTSTVSPLDSLKRNKQSPASSLSGRRSSGLAAFAAPPRRVSTRITASDLLFRSPAGTQRSVEDALPTDTPENQLASELDSATVEVDLNQPSFQEILDEPDLPPTPTQLGLERPPGRPKGLLSSSPNSQQGKWGRRRNTDGLEQSPSKLRRVDYGEGEESTEAGFGLDRTSLPEHVLEKRRLRNELVSEVQQLKKDIAELETWSKDLGQDGTNEPDSNELGRSVNIISYFLATSFCYQGTVDAPPEAPPVNPFALGEHTQTKAYISALAPLDLTAYSEPTPESAHGLVLERHTLKFYAPPPFPSIRYKASVTCDVNPVTRTLVSISVPPQADAVESRIPEDLHRWIDTRLANPLLRLDVTGLCWGINRYWEAMVSRAKLWSHIEEQHAELIAGHVKRSSGAITKRADNRYPRLEDSADFLRRSLPHIERTAMLFKSKRGSLQVLLSCGLVMDEWTSEPQLAAGINVSVLTESDGDSICKVDQESRRLFQSMLNESENNQTESSSGVHAGAILRATDCVLGALFSMDAQK
ncbi:hypothetical protein BO94DRAFT_550732 [Aspergillus sclerotioniger CBS 115572]|uniref:Uncharacterized protein n=1 Tax=Aspergillus sclerotioniger CBS 115572 TaxID=1450535 RepID=A0A317V672_9EURO|nr:hypothetical protein BO94DRAFT_550732 [Aspergillus sclerotioniger CBS 115572]PWY69834.1 hypothetical protein BO94DRAFT_550732 [Aspergillus sclerotioniger CBS 115572]